MHNNLSVYLCCLLIRAFASGEIITLIKENNLKCVATGSDVNSTIYLDPPTESVLTEKATIKCMRANSRLVGPQCTYQKGLNSKWITTSKYMGIVTDERWEDFEIYKNELHIFSLESNIKYGFSFCGEDTIESISISTYKKQNYNLLNGDERCKEWKHYELEKLVTNHGKTILIFHQAKEVVRKTFYWYPLPDITLVSSKPSLWKLHKLEFMEFQEYTDLVYTTFYMEISNSERTLVSMFVYSENKSKLEIDTEPTSDLTYLLDKKKWKKIMFEIGSNSSNNTKFRLWFSDENSTKLNKSFIIDDIKIIPKKLKMYEAMVPKDIYRCKSLNDSPQISTVTKNNCSSKYFGSHCDIKCSNILGSSSVNCERHKICDMNRHCFCASGYIGYNCKEECQSGHSNCETTCVEGCRHCVKGNCIRCQEGYLGEKCERKLPVLLEEPTLEDINENSIIIRLKNLKYSQDEVRPETCLIQYKEVNERDFKNCTRFPYSDNLPQKNFTIDSFSREKCICKIRIVLLVKDEFSTQGVPEIFIGSLRSYNVTTNRIALTWSSYAAMFSNNNYEIEYTCRQEFCEAHNVTSKREYTDNTNYLIENLKSFTKCSIRLYDVGETHVRQMKLIDILNVTTRNVSDIRDPAIFPIRIINLTNNVIKLEFESCNYFTEHLTYKFKFICISEWCKNTPGTITEFTKKMCKTEETVEITNLLPYTEYDVQISVDINRESSSKTLPAGRTPAARPNSVQNLSIYCRDPTTVWIKWEAPYPPTGIISHYIIKYLDTIDNDLNYTITSRDAKITGTNISNIRVQATNQDIEEAVTSSLPEQNSVAPAPEISSFKFVPPKKVSLIWKHQFLKDFQVVVQSINSSNNNNYRFDNCLQNYTHEIQLEQGVAEYTIKISGLLQSETTTALIKTRLLPLSLHPLIQLCTKSKCNLSVPRPQNSTKTRFEILVKEKRYNRTSWRIPNLNFTNNYICLEAGDHQAVSFENETYVMYLRDEYDSHEYPLFEATSIENDMLLSALISGISFCILLLLGYIIYACKFKKFPFSSRSSKERHKYKTALQQKTIELKMLVNPRSAVRDNLYDYSTTMNIKNLENCFLTDDEYSSYRHLIHQFQSLPGSTKPFTYALQDKNKNRNKDRTNVPYDYSRVVLSEMDGMGTHDYINASYINGYDRPKTYIATQGPKFYTIKDFWRMIWTEKIGTIVMATNFMENRKRKCAEYFPQTVNTVFECGQMSIKLNNEQVHEHYTSRIFKMYYKNINRRVQHLHLRWHPDVGTPLYADHIVAIVKQISQIRENSTTPIVIHCSAGVSRTGIIILCDLALQMVKSESSVDFYTLLKNMRDQRPNMLANEKQYILAHLVVLECLLEKENLFTMSPNEKCESTILKSQLKYLTQLERHDRIVQSWSKYDNNLYQSSMVHVLVDGYAKIQKYLVIQQPTKDRAQFFWDIIVKEKIETILFLNKMVHTIWPYSRQDAVLELTVSEEETLFSDDCTSTKLSILMIHLPTERVIFQHTVYFYQIHNLDPSSNIRNTNGIVNIVTDINQSCQTETRIVVACHDGITTSGLFLAFSYIIEKYQYEVEIDVCNAVRTIRRSGGKFIKTKKQLEILYKASSEYLQKFDPYTSAL